MPMRYTFGGDEHLFVECSEAMSLDAFFASLSMTKAIGEAGIKGITVIGANQVKRIDIARES